MLETGRWRPVSSITKTPKGSVPVKSEAKDPDTIVGEATGTVVVFGVTIQQKEIAS